jgi:5-methylcytosine-specific restriction endonuclease McrA
MNYLREILIDKMGGKCIECGSKEQLEFDHIDPSTKNFNISSAYNKTKEELFEELTKCQLLCNKCHLKKTKNNRDFVPKTNYNGGRPLKYKHLGETKHIRVPITASKVIIRLNEVMNKLEENGQDSVEVIMNTLDDIENSIL